MFDDEKSKSNKMTGFGQVFLILITFLSDFQGFDVINLAKHLFTFSLRRVVQKKKTEQFLLEFVDNR